MKTSSFIEPLEARIAPATIIVSNLASAGLGSLAAAVQNSHAGDSIVFKAGLSGLIHVHQEIDITHSLSINGGNKAITLSGDGQSRIFNIDDGLSTNATANIAGLIFRNGFLDSDSGAAIYTNENLNVTNCAFSQNTAHGGYGGAIGSFASIQLSLKNSTFSQNTASYGGAVCAYRPQFLTVSGCTFGANYAVNSAGALADYGGDFSISNTQFHANTAMEGPGAVYLEAQNGTSTISNSSFSKNAVTMRTGEFQSVSGLYLRMTPGAKVVMGHTIFESNSGGYYGALVVDAQSDQKQSLAFSMTDCTVKNNQALDYGAGITFINNLFDAPAALSITLSKTVVTQNQVGQTAGGAGIYLESGFLTLNQSTVRDNLGSAGVYVSGGTLNVIASTIKNNSGGNIVHA